MKGGLFVFFAFIIWSISFYRHFWLAPASKLMVAFVGKEHSQMFAHMFRDYGDLWAFGHRWRRSLNIHFEPLGTHFDIFRRESYDHMLIINKLIHIPMMFDTDSVVRYIHNNETVGSLWPKEIDFSPSSMLMSEWFIENKDYIENIHI